MIELELVTESPFLLRKLGYETFHIFDVYEFFSWLCVVRDLKAKGIAVKPLRFNGSKISLESNRLLTFTKGLDCAICRKAHILFFAVQRHYGCASRYHINAWGTRDGKTLTLFNSDHIHPVSRGGTGELENRQPACHYCNNKKGDRLPGESKSPSEIRTRFVSKFAALVNSTPVPLIGHAVKGSHAEIKRKQRLIKTIRVLFELGVTEEEIGQILGAQKLFRLERSWSQDWAWRALMQKYIELRLQWLGGEKLMEKGAS